MLPSSRHVSPMEDAKANGDAPTRISTVTKADSSLAVVACFVLPPKQAETLISVLQEFMSSADGLVPDTFRPWQLPHTTIQRPFG